MPKRPATPSTPGTPTLRELSKRWLQESLGVISPETLRHYSWYIGQYALPQLGDSLSVSEADARALYDGILSAGKAPTVASATLRVLRRVLEYGASTGVCDAPAWDLDLCRPPRKKELVILTPDEERQLSDCLVAQPSNRNLGLFLMLTTGIGVGEVLALRWKDVSFQGHTLRILTERGPENGRKRTTRTVPIGERQRLYLRKLKGLPECYVCSGTPKPLSKTLLSQALGRVVHEQVLPPLPPMCLRHTFAVRAIEAGMGYEELAKRLGLDNGGNFRRTYRALVSEEQRERLERERLENRRPHRSPEHRNRGERDPEATPYRMQIEKRRGELKAELDALEGELAILRNLRNSDCVQGSHRKAFYDFMARVLPDDKDAAYAVEYLRANMRVADMPLLAETTPQAIRRRVTHGFEKLSARLEEIYAVEGWDMLGTFNALCDAIVAAAPPEPKRTGPKPRPTVENRYRQALAALARLRAHLANKSSINTTL